MGKYSDYKKLRFYCIDCPRFFLKGFRGNKASKHLHCPCSYYKRQIKSLKNNGVCRSMVGH